MQPTDGSQHEAKGTQAACNQKSSSKEASTNGNHTNGAHKQPAEPNERAKPMADQPRNPNTPDPPAPTANAWFDNLFPGVAVRLVSAFLESEPTKDDATRYVTAINETTLAGALTTYTSRPIVWMRSEGQFFRYGDAGDAGEGIYTPVNPEDLTGKVRELLTDCYKTCHRPKDLIAPYDANHIYARIGKGGTFGNVLLAIKDQTIKNPDFFKTCSDGYMAAKNCMVKLSDRSTVPFSPEFNRRAKFNVDYIAGATCPRFISEVLEPNMSADDIELLQRYFGLLLSGVNSPQKIMLITGTAGGGKSSLARIFIIIIGDTHTATLRTQFLEERFEMAQYIGKDLLFGPDVPANFLNTISAGALKRLTGGDWIQAEIKGVNERIGFYGNFNVLITANSRLNVRLEGDTEAWRRRLVLIEYKNPKPETVDPKFAENIVAEEGPGILNWGLDGYDKLIRDGCLLNLNDRQREAVDLLLLESDSVACFAEHCVYRAPRESLTLENAYSCYVSFCHQNDWKPFPRKTFSAELINFIQRMFTLQLRHNIRNAEGRNARGWAGLKCVLPSSSEPEPET